VSCWPGRPAINPARVVIIGGGVAGCSIAYHLAIGGWRDVLVLERGELTGGSTFHSAGLVGQLRASGALARLNMLSVARYRTLAAETGRDPGWKPVGSLRVASSPARLAELGRLLEHGRALGLPVEMIGAAEARARFSFMSAEGVEGALWLPTDGRVDPAGLAQAFAAGARRLGVRVLTGTRVRAIRRVRGRVVGVEVDEDEVDCEVVVNAAGIWAPEVAALAGTPVPVVPLAHQYIVTAPFGVPRDLPILRDPDHRVYFREEVGGLLVGGFERTPAAWGLDGIPSDFIHKLLPPDWERFGALLAGAVARVPVLADTQVITMIRGPEAFTPDGEFVLGSVPGVEGLFVAAGFCAHGIAGAGGVGRVMAAWIMDGRPPIDLVSMDVRRFAERPVDRQDAVAGALRTYGTYYDIRPAVEPRAGGATTTQATT
jgi:4-methylaminobutanoate oxidase (formaldehyde-forming)